jgi:cobalamin biosynthesis protein CbiG
MKNSYSVAISAALHGHAGGCQYLAVKMADNTEAVPAANSAANFGNQNCLPFGLIVKKWTRDRQQTEYYS